MNLVGPVFVIMFDDRDVPPEVFGGEQAEAGARARFEQVLTNWNANLFQRIDDGRRPRPQLWECKFCKNVFMQPDTYYCINCARCPHGIRSPHECRNGCSQSDAAGESK